MQTLHVSTPTWLSRSPLQPNILSIRSDTCKLMECHGGIESSQSHILLCLLLDLVVELGNSGCEQHSHSRVSGEKCGTWGRSAMFWEDGVGM